MPDVEKVIKGLEICSAGEWNSTGGRDHTDCPYYPAGYTGCTCKLLMRDALALLKAQEPRVMTPEDFENNPNVDQYGCLPCWMEYREEPKWDGWAEATVHTCVEYGRRPWTSRPTDKQMEAVKWE